MRALIASVKTKPLFRLGQKQHPNTARRLSGFWQIAVGVYEPMSVVALRTDRAIGQRPVFTHEH